MREGLPHHLFNPWGCWLRGRAHSQTLVRYGLLTIHSSNIEALPLQRKEGLSKGGDHVCLLETPNGEKRKQSAERGSTLATDVGRTSVFCLYPSVLVFLSS